MSTLILSSVFAGTPVRVYGTPENPLFVAADVCRILDLDNVTRAIESLEPDEKITLTNPQGNPRAGIPLQFNVVTESGLYALIFKSRKPEAKAFRKWITAEVIPALRKTGSYGLAMPQTLPEALRAYADAVEARERLVLENGQLVRQAEVLLAENETLAPKALLYDAAMASKDLLKIGEVAKILYSDETAMGQNRLFEFLRREKILRNCPDSPKQHNVPFQYFIDQGYFRVREFPFNSHHGPKINTITYATQKGLEFIRRRLSRNGGVK